MEIRIKFVYRFVELFPFCHRHLLLALGSISDGTDYIFCRCFELGLVKQLDEGLVLHNNLALVRKEKGLSQAELARLVGVSRNTISSIETGQFNPTAKLALIICIALDKKFEELFYF